MKKLVSLLLAAIMLLTFVSCSEKKNEGESQQPITQNHTTPKATQSAELNTATPTSEQNTVVPTVEPTAAEDKHLELVTASSLDAFHEGLAWVHFRKVSRDFYANGDVSEKIYEDYVGCIDKTGKIVFYFPGKSTQWTGFSNGVAYWENKGTLYLIDKTGNVLSKHSTDESSKEQAILWQDGYVLTHENKLSFSENSNTYKIYNQSGDVVNILEDVIKKYDWEYNWIYCGMGIFHCSAVDPKNIFMKCDGTLFTVDKLDEIPCFVDDRAVVGTIYRDSNDKRFWGVKLMDAEFNFSEQWSRIEGNRGLFSENHLLIYDRTLYWNDPYEAIHSINNELNTYSELEQEYLQYVRYMDESLTSLTDGRYAFNMIGADGNKYVGLFDEKLKIVGEPILGEFYGFSCGHLFVRRINHGSYCVYVYDKDGNELFTIYSDKSYDRSIGYFGYLGANVSLDEMNKLTQLYSDDTLLVGKFGAVPEISDDGEIVNREGFKGIYLDLDGNILFESIDFSTGVEISIE